MFPTQKPHVSYSEIRTWKECPYRHKLTYIDKLTVDEPSQYLDYGTILHDCLENFLKTKNLDLDTFENKLVAAWEKAGYDTDEYKEMLTEAATIKGEKPRILEPLEDWIKWGRFSASAVPQFLDENFKDWKTIAAEQALYEDIPSDDVKFKGFIDVVLEAQGRSKNSRKIWILDWKTAPTYGWHARKRRDFLVQAQIALYKKFWRVKNDYDCPDVGAGFVLLKRGAKKNPVDLFKVSVGPKMEEKAEKLLRSMLKTVRTGIYIKNRNSCKYCPYFNTEHCT